MKLLNEKKNTLLFCLFLGISSKKIFCGIYMYIPQRTFISTTKKWEEQRVMTI